MQATKERCPAPCLTGLGGLSHGSVLHAGRCLQTLLRLQDGTQKPWPSRSHFLPQSSGRLLKPQAPTLKIRHKLAAFFKAPKSAVPIYFSSSHGGAAGNRSAWKTPCCKLLVISLLEDVSWAHSVSWAQGPCSVSQIRRWAVLCKS